MLKCFTPTGVFLFAFFSAQYLVTLCLVYVVDFLLGSLTFKIIVPFGFFSLSVKKTKQKKTSASVDGLQEWRLCYVRTATTEAGSSARPLWWLRTASQSLIGHVLLLSGPQGCERRTKCQFPPLSLCEGWVTARTSRQFITVLMRRDKQGQSR